MNGGLSYDTCKNIRQVSSELKEERKVDETNYSRQEFSYQSFQRSFTIPEGTIDGDSLITLNQQKRALHL